MAVAGLWVSVAGLMVGLVALLITLRLRKSRKAKELARRYSVPALKQILADFDAAIEAGNPQLIRRHLDSWRYLAASACGLLSDAEPDGQVVRGCLKTSLALARDSGAASHKGGKYAQSAYIEARKAMTVALDGLNSWVSRQSSRR